MNTPAFIELELIGSVNFYIGMTIEVITALVLGALVGFERERRMKSAGIKTNVLICLGACIYTSISLLNIPEGSIADPNRTAAQIVSGIGFLGAGAIIQSRGNVTGLTTAAGIWVVAAIGIAIGSGYPFLAILFTTAMLIVLRLLKPLSRLATPKTPRPYRLEVMSTGKVKKQVQQILSPEVGELKRLKEECVDKECDERVLHLELKAHPKKIDSLCKRIEALAKVESIEYSAISKPLAKAG